MKTRPIAFSSSSDGDEDIYLMNWDGQIIRRCTNSIRKGVTNRTPEWSPDASWIAFQSNQDDQRELYLLEVASDKVIRLTHTPNGGASMQPAWSPDGRRVAICSDRGVGTQLYIIDVDGRNEKQFSPEGHTGKQFWNPDWTPDGNRVSYIVRGYNGTNDQLWTSALDGSDSRRVSPIELPVFEYDFSPDGREIIFDVRLDQESLIGDWDIFKMNVDGTSIKRLTDLPAVSSRPKWLSDGNTIVFHTNRFGVNLKEPERESSLETWFEWWNQFEICVMDSNGSNVRRLTSNKLRDLHPDG